MGRNIQHLVSTAPVGRIKYTHLNCCDFAPLSAALKMTTCFFRYCPVWIVGFSIFIGGGFYEHLQGGELGYFLVSFFVFLPCVAYPLLRPGEADKHRPILERRGARVCFQFGFGLVFLFSCWSALFDVAQVLAQVQPLDLHLRLGGQLLLDALFLCRASRQVCSTFLLPHARSPPHLTALHVHILDAMANQRRAHRVLSHDPCLLHLLSLHDQSHPSTSAPRSIAILPFRLICSICRGHPGACLRHGFHGDIHHIQFPSLLFRESRFRLHHRLRFLCHILHRFLPHVPAHRRTSARHQVNARAAVLLPSCDSVPTHAAAANGRWRASL